MPLTIAHYHSFTSNIVVPGSNPASLQPAGTCHSLLGSQQGWHDNCRLASEGRQRQKKNTKIPKNNKKTKIKKPRPSVTGPLLCMYCTLCGIRLQIRALGFEPTMVGSVSYEGETMWVNPWVSPIGLDLSGAGTSPTWWIPTLVSNNNYLCLGFLILNIVCLSPTVSCPRVCQGCTRTCSRWPGGEIIFES